MRVVRLRAAGGPEQLVVEDADRRRPGPAEALVRVHAAAITRGELEWPVDRLPAIPSYELSGVVEEVGPGVAGVAPGDEVFALTPFDRDGVAAGYAAVPAELLVPKPRALVACRERRDPAARTQRLAGPVRPRPARRRRARADPRCRGQRRRVRGAARPRGRRARDRDRIGGEPGFRSSSSAHTRSWTRRGASRTPWNPSTSSSTPSAASGCVAPSPCCVPAGDWSRWQRSRPREACTSSSSRIATSSARSRGWWMRRSASPARRGLPAHSAREAFARSLEPGRRGKVVLAVDDRATGSTDRSPSRRPLSARAS